MPDTITLEKTCPFCGRRYQRAFTTDGYYAWKNGAHVQDAFPNETAEAREFLITYLSGVFRVYGMRRRCR